MTVSLSDEQRRTIALAEDVTGVTVTDCVFDDEHDQVAFVVAAGEMGKAIGSGGETVGRLEERLGQSVTLIEDAQTPEAFVASTLAPAAVRDVSIEDGDDGPVAYADVADGDTGVAIGADGRRIDLARRLAGRHFDLADVRVD